MVSHDSFRPERLLATHARRRKDPILFFRIAGGLAPTLQILKHSVIEWQQLFAFFGFDGTEPLVPDRFVDVKRLFEPIDIPPLPSKNLSSPQRLERALANDFWLSPNFCLSESCDSIRLLAEVRALPDTSDGHRNDGRFGATMWPHSVQRKKSARQSIVLKSAPLTQYGHH